MLTRIGQVSMQRGLMPLIVALLLAVPPSWLVHFVYAYTYLFAELPVDERT
ncbi:hypothetical protein W824_15120 [Clavibacter cf. michiganensis LMG 26808]|nr:hypothetical protein W824_15120 [Clavibacter cf. michiganensis LMG 26808]